MQILHVYKDYPPILGGIENHVKVLAEGQAARGHSVTVLVTNPAGLRTSVTRESDVRVIRAGRLATVASTPISLALPWQLLRQRPDIVHLHFPYPVAETSQWLLRRGCATVLTYHSDVVRQAKILRLYKPLLRRTLRAVHTIIVSSPAMGRSAYLAEHQAKLQLIPFGIPLARFQARPAEGILAARRTDLADRLTLGPDTAGTGLPAGAPTGSPAMLLFVGRLRYYKGLDTLIRALPRIPAVLIVGGSGPMEAEWRALAERMGVAGRIAWLGEVPDADLPALYHLADMFVLPASHPSEAFGLVQLEAMGAGLPVVCTELGTGTSYVNQDGVTGRVVPPRDPSALASAINDLLSDPARRGAMSLAASRRAAAEFDSEIMLDRVLSLYSALLLRFAPPCGKIT